jgi:hypothetical protein
MILVEVMVVTIVVAASAGVLKICNIGYSDPKLQLAKCK